MNKFLVSIICTLLLFSCTDEKGKSTFSLNEELKNTVNIKGQKDNGNYLYVTAGNMLYSIGDHYGGFPEIGFHVPGEMGGVWQHPIKLLDGFKLSVNNSDLGECTQFIAYPFANQFEYLQNQEISVIRTDFVPDSLPVLVVEYLIQNNTSDVKKIDLSLRVDSDLSPVWLGERSGMIDSRDTLLGIKENNAIIVKDSLNEWYAGISSETDSLIIASSEDSRLKGKGISIRLNIPAQDLKAKEKKIVRFYMSGSMKNTTEIDQNLKIAKENIKNLFADKKQRYADIDRRAEITIPDTLLMQAYRWGKYNTDWLVRDVPGMGQGLNAGLPDYPWFFSNDQSSAFSALVGTVEPCLFYNSWDMLLRISNEYNNNSGRIVHEVSTNGQVYDKGRMEESQEFINTAWTVFKWTGNKDFLKTYYDHGKKVWQFLQEHDTDNNLYVEGYGGVEIEGLNDEMLDVAYHTQTFLQTMAEMALVFGESDLSKEYSEKAEILKKKINEDWWNESENRYFDFISNKSKALQLIDMALEKRVSDNRNKWAKEKLTDLKIKIKNGEYNEKGYSVYYNPSTGVLTSDVADKEKAVKYLESVPFFTNKYGLYISGIARPDDITLEEGSVAHRLTGEFNYHEAIMGGATSGLAIAECKYRGADYAMPYIEKILNNFSFATPGTTYEVSPDYGMFVQAWNVSGINIPLIQYIFGVNPMAYKKEITIKPDMPSKWDYAKLERLLVGNNELSIDFKKSENKRIYVIENSQKDWVVNFKLAENVNSAMVNGKEVKADNGTISLTRAKNTIEF
ncbi:conserved hypothetical protein [uncultured Dysgonomonas sp.]|uniref:Alpha-L-rhamnosidase six-hairpin glycosidase domain-containing protein n=1 Tax=uncultured Dysgonomonas sp. TaxID=206096 RepID=A0A212J2S5_9BACT|nr:hypothetical protein [uncultured Dysgonomonas sp.]SBV93730.1 conserved hypothetical protein [uncultured Dysgonomonas sp.]